MTAIILALFGLRVPAGPDALPRDSDSAYYVQVSAQTINVLPERI
jgi:hypothetical protein